MGGEKEKGENKRQIEGRFIDKAQAETRLEALNSALSQAKEQYEIATSRKESLQEGRRSATSSS